MEESLHTNCRAVTARLTAVLTSSYRLETLIVDIQSIGTPRDGEIEANRGSEDAVALAAPCINGVSGVRC